jgi:hypothetical protein
MAFDTLCFFTLAEVVSSLRIVSAPTATEESMILVPLISKTCGWLTAGLSTLAGVIDSDSSSSYAWAESAVTSSKTEMVIIFKTYINL